MDEDMGPLLPSQGPTDGGDSIEASRTRGFEGRVLEVATALAWHKCVRATAGREAQGPPGASGHFWARVTGVPLAGSSDL